MEITIRIIYQGFESKILQRGSFPVNVKLFKENPDQEAANVTYTWLQQIRREAHVEEILEVVYDNDKDITELVKEMEKATLD